MAFAERYIAALNSKNLQDDDTHHSTDALAAAGIADMGGGSIMGSLLARVKFADGVANSTIDVSGSNLAQLLKQWYLVVEQKGRARVWVKVVTDRDVQTAHALYKRVAERSLAHWLDGNCKFCNGTKVVGAAACKECFGTGSAHIEGGSQYERERVRDMVSELESVYQAHGGRAGSLLRRLA